MSNNLIDLRSDTITQPTSGMLQAMMTATVGDDVLGDDPSVKELEAETARLMGMEAAVFMPSGTMTNQVAVRAHTEPGDEILLADNAHIYFYEAGAPAALAGVMCRLLPNEGGVFTPEVLAQYLRPPDIHFPTSKLVCVENTSNRGGGTCWPLEQLDALVAFCQERGLKLHMDGARLWNAAIAQQQPEARLVQGFASVSVCFSKGLGAPVGSALAGSKKFIDRARRFRKQYGGGMRQAGFLAAAALYALKHHRARLADDHAHARALATGLAEVDGVSINWETLQTNMFYLNLEPFSAQTFQALLAEKGVAVMATGPHTIRVVTHLMFTADQVDPTLTMMKAALQELRHASPTP